MIDFLLGVPGKLKAIADHLTTYWTSTRAAKLDLLTVPPAPASTALTNATWTDTRAATLDASFTRSQTFTSNGTWVRPAGISRVNVLLVGGGGGGSNGNGSTAWGHSGAAGWISYAENVIVTSDVSVTVGAGGSGYTPGGTSYFGNLRAPGGNYGLPYDDVSGAHALVGGITTHCACAGYVAVNGIGYAGTPPGTSVIVGNGGSAPANSGAGGGGGGRDFGNVGGSGGSGVVIVQW